MNRLSVCRYQDQIVSFYRQLSGTDGREGVDHPEPVPPARSDREDLQGRVGHEAGVGVPELPFAVDEAALRVLAGVDGEPSWETFWCILVHPVAEEHDVRGQVVVVEVAVGVSRRGLADHDAAVQTVHLLEAGVGVPEVSAGVSGNPLISTNKTEYTGQSVKAKSVNCSLFTQH